MKTTINKIRKITKDGLFSGTLWPRLGKTDYDDEPLAISTIAELHGIDFALHCLSAVDGHDKAMRMFALWCARRIKRLETDPVAAALLDLLEEHAKGDAAESALELVADAAYLVFSLFEHDDDELATLYHAIFAATGEAACSAAAYAAHVARGDRTKNAAAHAAEKEAQKRELLRVCAEIDKAKGVTK